MNFQVLDDFSAVGCIICFTFDLMRNKMQKCNSDLTPTLLEKFAKTHTHTHVFVIYIQKNNSIFSPREVFLICKLYNPFHFYWTLNSRESVQGYSKLSVIWKRKYANSESYGKESSQMGDKEFFTNQIL